MLLKSDPSTQDHPRKAMFELTANAPRWIHRPVQAFFDWLTGYYLTPPLWKSNPWLELLYGVTQYTGGLGLVSLGFLSYKWELIPLGISLSVAGAAQLQEVAHFCAHNAFFANATHNYVLGCAITLLTGKKPFPIFKASHLLIHHPPLILGTMEDEGNTPYLVKDLGFAFGEDLDFYPKHLGQILLSPWFYWDTARSRLINLGKAPQSYKIATMILGFLVALLMHLTQTWLIGLSWWILTQLGSYGAALLQQLPEHDWGYQPYPQEGAKSQVVNKSFVLYLGSAPPKSKFGLSWVKWFASLGIDVVIRLTLLPVTLSAHGVHHALPNDRNWANQLVTLKDFQAGSIKGWDSYQFLEVWGYFKGLNHVFLNLSKRKDQE